MPGGGWPAAGLTEVLTGHYGIGELSLLMPALARLGQDGGADCIVWIAPPHIPYAPALHSRGVDPDRVLVVRRQADASGSRDILWATEQALRSGSCGAVLAWPRCVDQTALRRLQLAAETGRCWAILFRPPQAARQRSPAALRMRLTATGEQTRIEILKCRGGRPGAVSIRFDDRHPGGAPDGVDGCVAAAAGKRTGPGSGGVDGCVAAGCADAAG